MARVDCLVTTDGGFDEATQPLIRCDLVRIGRSLLQPIARNPDRMPIHNQPNELARKNGKQL